VEIPVLPVLSSAQRKFPMYRQVASKSPIAPALKRWSRSRARGICPRRHLRVLPIRTRPSLFGGD
jgi:hypothetical protein